MPPGTEKERVEAMRRAFDDTMKDVEFLAEAKAASLEINPYTGAQVAELLRKAYASPPAVIEEARRAIAN